MKDKNSACMEINKNRNKIKWIQKVVVPRSRSGSFSKKWPSQYKREILPCLSGTPQIVRMLFHTAASTKHECRSGLLPRHLAISAASKLVPPKYILLKHLLDMTTDFGLITHKKWLIHFNALLGDTTILLMAQEDVSLPQNSHLEPKNKVEI